MATQFQGLAEFEALPIEEKIDLDNAKALLDRLCFRKLNALLSKITLLRALGMRRWVKELSKVTSLPVTLHLTKEKITPYMQEDGKIFLSKKEIFHIDKLFMIFAHETAHFILIEDKSYAMIKEADNEYRRIPDREQRMTSPIELSANVITLMILERCKTVEKRAKRLEIIANCQKTLENQLTL